MCLKNGTIFYIHKPKPSMKYIAQILFIFLILSCSSNKSIGQDKISKKAQEYYQQADEKLAFGKIDEATIGFEKAVEEQPSFLNAHIQLAGIYQNYKKDYAKAAHHYDKVKQLDPSLINAFYNSVICYYLAMQYDNAERALKEYFAFKDLGPKSKVEGDELKKRIDFSRQAIKNPVPFEPQNLGSGVNSDKAEYFPAITADNEFIYFTVNDKDSRYPNEDIFVSRNKDGNWQQRQPLNNVINTAYQEGAHSISQDGRYLFFASDRPQGNKGRFDIYMAKKVGNDWKNPVNIGAPINSPNWESQPVFTADAKSMLFVRKSKDGYGGSDIYISHIQQDGSFGAPQNLGPTINTAGDEQRPYLHPDGKTLYFSSTGHIGLGGGDVFVSRLGENGEWSTPENLGYPINTPGDEYGIYVSADGQTAYFSSDRAGGFGDMDLYSFTLPTLARPEIVVYLKGVLQDAQNNKPLEGSIKIFDLSNGELYKSLSSDAISGEFLVTLPSNKNYMYEAIAKGYLPYSENFSLQNISTGNNYNLNVSLQKIEVGKEFILKNIFFSSNSFELKPESKTELTQLVDFLEKNPTLKLEIGGHTDNVGTDAANISLSEKRAKSVQDFLIERGVAKERLTFKGYGSAKPIVPNDTIENKAKNRRTAFKVF